MTDSTELPRQFPFWYIAGKTAFSAKKGMVTISPGLLIANDAETGSELYRYLLTSDIEIRTPLGGASIVYLDGQSYRTNDKQHSFWFYNPKWIIITAWPMIFSYGKNKQFARICLEASTH